MFSKEMRKGKDTEQVIRDMAFSNYKGLKISSEHSVQNIQFQNPLMILSVDWQLTPKFTQLRHAWQLEVDIPEWLFYIP